MAGKRTEANRAGINPTIVITSGRRVYSLARLGSTELLEQRRRSAFLAPRRPRLPRSPHSRAPFARRALAPSNGSGAPCRICRGALDLVLLEPRAATGALHGSLRDLSGGGPPTGRRAHFRRPALRVVDQRRASRAGRSAARRPGAGGGRHVAAARRTQFRRDPGREPRRDRRDSLRPRPGRRSARAGQRAGLDDRPGRPASRSSRPRKGRPARTAAPASLGMARADHRKGRLLQGLDGQSFTVHPGRGKREGERSAVAERR